MTEKDVGRYLRQALDDDNADTRRTAIERLSKTRFANHETVIDTCRLIARTDRSESVRCAAIRLITESRRPDVVETLLGLVDPRKDKKTVATSDRVRLDALHALYFMVRNGLVAQEQSEAVAAAAVAQLRQSPSRDVRIAAARLLGYLPYEETLSALISGLNHPDFGVVYTCERSLMRLTGVTQHHDPDAWRTWRRATEAPFAMRGQLDAQLEPAGAKSWWQKMTLSVKHAFSGFMPKRSE